MLKKPKNRPTLNSEYNLVARFSADKNFWFASADEVGRGSLFGPVAVGIFCWNSNTLEQLQKAPYFPEIRDSKALSKVKRLSLYNFLKKDFLGIVSCVGSEFIDRYNINAAIVYALSRALRSAKTKGLYPKHLFLDGNYSLSSTYLRSEKFPESRRGIGIDIPITSEVSADANSVTVAAASILAKVTRDTLIAKAAHKYPGMGLENNFGYGTAQHREYIVQNGPKLYHRKTFLGKILKKTKS